MASFMEIFGGEEGMDIGPGIGALGIGQLDASPPPTIMDVDRTRYDNSQAALTPDGGMSNETMGAILGAVGSLAGLAGSFQDVKNEKRAMQLKQSELKINKILAKGAFDRNMTSLFNSHKDLEEQSMQQHVKRETAYKQKMGSMRVMQAERGMEGTSAGETRDNLTRSNLMAEQVMLGNLKKAQRSLMYQREGISDVRMAQELGFDMPNANFQAQLEASSWVQAMADTPDLALNGFNTYFNFIKDSGRGGDI